MRSQNLRTTNLEFLNQLAAEAAEACLASTDGAGSPTTTDDDYFQEIEDPDLLVGATTIARWRFRLVDVTDADRKRIYYEAKTRGPEAGYGTLPKNKITLSKSKYRAFRARMNGGA
jgi:hypothetical protein